MGHSIVIHLIWIKIQTAKILFFYFLIFWSLIDVNHDVFGFFFYHF